MRRFRVSENAYLLEACRCGKHPRVWPTYMVYLVWRPLNRKEVHP